MAKKIELGKAWKNVLTGMLLLSVMGFGLAGCGSSGTGPTQTAGTGTNAASSQTSVTQSNGNNVTDNKQSGVDTDNDGIPDSVEKSYGTNPYVADTDGDGVNDKTDKEPLNAQNPIKETSSAPLELIIKDARVEDNATADHLEITMNNKGKTVLNNFNIYYTITDKLTKTQESYFQTLAGLSLNPGETKTIHFDNQVSQAGHYFGNMNGLYGTSKNGLTFAIQLHAKNFKPMEFKVEKAKGTAEVAD